MGYLISRGGECNNYVGAQIIINVANFELFWEKFFLQRPPPPKYCLAKASAACCKIVFLPVEGVHNGRRIDQDFSTKRSDYDKNSCFGESSDILLVVLVLMGLHHLGCIKGWFIVFIQLKNSSLLC